MPVSIPKSSTVRRALAISMALAALVLPAGALGAQSSTAHRIGHHGSHLAKVRGALVQLRGSRGCLVDRSERGSRCGSARALEGPGPFMGSRAIALSPDGHNVYVASSDSDAIAIFVRNPRLGTLKQRKRELGCVSDGGAAGCQKAVGLDGPNSIAVSPDGRNVYATSRDSSSVTVFRRDRSTGALKQLRNGAGCLAGVAAPGCNEGRALDGPDVVTVSPDGDNVYVGSFLGNEIAVFNRDRTSGALHQPTDSSGCIAEAVTDGCEQGLALAAPEGMAIGADGKSVYVASAASNAVVVLSRNRSTGALTQAADGSGCIVSGGLDGCSTGSLLSGANAVAVAPGRGDVYVTSLLSNSVTSFRRSISTGVLTQSTARSACVVWPKASGNCSRARAMSAPEGLAVSPDGANVYVAAFGSGAITILDRNRRSGAVVQKRHRVGCVSSDSRSRSCSRARALDGVSSIALSPDGRFLYSTSYKSNAVNIFRRVTGRRHR